MEPSTFKFGMRAKVRDSITQTSYVVIGRMEYTSYLAYYVQPVVPDYSNGKPGDPAWLDEDRLEPEPEVQAPQD